MRSDVSNYLIHFVHRISLSEIPDQLPEDIEDSVFCYSDPEVEHSDFAVLRCIVKECGLRYSRSFRKKRTTVYGGDPVICFTEMPFSSYLEYVRTRDRGAFISSYGLAIRKSAGFKAGARPVIYGLSEDNHFDLKEDLPESRVLQPHVLPFSEQYRFVPYVLNDGARIDWTHEREWRLKRPHGGVHNIVCGLDGRYIEVPALNIFDKECLEGELVLFVKTQDEARELQESIQMLHDAGGNTYDIPFNRNRISILVVDEYLKSFAHINDISLLPSKCFFQATFRPLEDSFLEKVREVVGRARTSKSLEVVESIFRQHGLEVGERQSYDFGGPCGWSSIVVRSPQSPIVRALKELGFAESLGSFYVIDAVSDSVPASQSLEYNEQLAKAIASFLNEELETDIFGTNTYLD